MLKPRIYVCFKKMMRLQNKWSSVLWLEALCYFKMVVFGNSYYVFYLVKSFLYTNLLGSMLLCTTSVDQ
jgi:hypothetical protein